VKKATSFKEAETFDDEYYKNLSSSERIETVQFLREQHFKLNGLNFNENRNDCEEFLELLNKHKVKYCIIGSYAIAFHARPRYTKDMDILVDASVENAKKIIAVLNEFGFGSVNLTEQDFSVKGNIVQLGYEPVRIDIITSIKGLDFADVWNNKVNGQFGKQKVYFIDRKNLIKSKTISNRTQDRADIELLSDNPD